MSEATNIAPEQESKEAQEQGAETIGDALKTEPPKQETVPLSVLIEQKKANKELVKQLAELKKSITEGASKSETAETVSALIEEYPDLDPNFLKKLSSSIASEVKKEAEEKLAERLKPIAEREESARIEKVFAENYEKVLAQNPDYKDVANREVIKQLSLLPQNANKTFSQLIEETYGHVVSKGKPSIDRAVTGAGRQEEVTLDESRIHDPAYFKEVQANPELRKQYQKGIIGRVSRYL